LLLSTQYISASCVISNHIAYKNKRPEFENRSADLQAFLLSLYHFLGLNYPKFHKMDRLSKLGWLASELLIKNEIEPGYYLPEETGVILSNASSSLDTDIRYAKSLTTIPSPSLFVYTLPNIVIGEICIKNGFKGENAFFIAEHFDANFIKQYVSNLINNNILQACICGWVELLEENYKAALFLVEKKSRRGSIIFSEENILTLYHQDNG
jgi:hypothetical protein